MVTTVPQRPSLLVIGTGVGGAMVAYKAARAGVRTTMIDCGPRLDRETLLERYRTEAPQSLMSPYPLVPHAPQPGVARTDDYLIQKGPDPYDQQYIRAVGGTTWHWGGATWRYIPNDFRLKSLYGVGRDWPISYDDLEPFYLEAERELGVAGPTGADGNGPRSAPYPMEALPLSYMDQVFKEKAEALGENLIQAPQSKNNAQVYDGRPPCCGNANCMPLCPIGAQYSGNVHAEKAEAQGAELITDAVVHFLEVGKDGRILAARYLKPDGEEFRIEADHFVLAANGIEGPKILLMSKQENAPDGVANRSDMVGRNLMDHPGSGSRWYSKDPVWPGRGPMILSGVVSTRDGDFRRHTAARKLQPSNFNPVAWVTAEAIEEGLTGDALREAVRWRAARRMILWGLHEQLPDPQNRIVPSTEKLTDSLGIPRPEIRYRVDDYTWNSIRAAHEFAEKLGKLYGAETVEHDDGFSGNNHITGATIMGDDPRDSVTDGFGRTHDHGNLWISSSSNFPSVSSVNVTLTIAAMAIRMADRIVQEARR